MLGLFQFSKILNPKLLQLKLWQSFKGQHLLKYIHVLRDLNIDFKSNVIFKGILDCCLSWLYSADWTQTTGTISTVLVYQRYPERKWHMKHPCIQRTVRVPRGISNDNKCPCETNWIKSYILIVDPLTTVRAQKQYPNLPVIWMNEAESLSKSEYLST